jgi:hypothetical protein
MTILDVLIVALAVSAWLLLVLWVETYYRNATVRRLYRLTRADKKENDVQDG